MAAAVTCERLAILIHDFSAGGTERIALRLANEWADRGREVRVICGNPIGPSMGLLNDAVQLVSPLVPIERGLGSRRRLGQFAATICAEHDIEGLFIPGNFHFAAMPSFAAAGGRFRPIVIAQLSNPVRRSDRGKLRQILARHRLARRLRTADAVVAMSAALAQEARESLGALPLSIIPSPVLPSTSGPAPSARPKTLRLVAAGRFVAQKNLSLAVRTMGALEDRQARLTILGDGPERAAVERLARAIGISDQVDFAGHADAITPWLLHASAFLLTSRYEGYPAVAIEALAAGIPVVSTDCSPAMHEILDDPSLGEVVRSNDPDDLAGAVKRVLGRPPATAQLTASIIERHLMGEVAPRYLDLFDELFCAKARQRQS